MALVVKAEMVVLRPAGDDGLCRLSRMLRPAFLVESIFRTTIVWRHGARGDLQARGIRQSDFTFR